MRQDGIAIIEPIIARTAQAPLSATLEPPARAGEARVSLMVTGLVPTCWHCERALVGDAKLIIAKPHEVAEDEGGRMLDRRAVILLCPYCDGEIMRFQGEVHYQL